jgi:hypothetical protein
MIECVMKDEIHFRNSSRPQSKNGHSVSCCRSVRIRTGTSPSDTASQGWERTSHPMRCSVSTLSPARCSSPSRWTERGDHLTMWVTHTHTTTHAQLCNELVTGWLVVQVDYWLREWRVRSGGYSHMTFNKYKRSYRPWKWLNHCG